MIDNNGKSFYVKTWNHFGKATCQGSNKDFVRIRIVQRWNVLDIDEMQHVEGSPDIFAVFDLLYKTNEYEKVDNAPAF